VAVVMSNPWTYSAAVALSTATSASLRAFITAIQGLLSGLGAAQLGAEIAALVQIISEIEKLVQGLDGSKLVGRVRLGADQRDHRVDPDHHAGRAAAGASASGQAAVQGGQSAIPGITTTPRPRSPASTVRPARARPRRPVSRPV